MNYYLAEACENTFILVDALKNSSWNISDVFLNNVHSCLLQEKRDDALILVNGEANGASFHVQYLVLGADGKLAEFCGNGARACAAYLYQNYPQFKQFYIKYNGCLYKLLKYSENIYSTQLESARFELNKKFINHVEIHQDSNKYNYFVYGGKQFYYVEVMEPHLIVKENLNEDELFYWGRKLNYQSNLFPLGINLNASITLDDNTLQVCTYERGVHRLTRSCGTGSSAAAALYLNGRQGNCSVITPGGKLEISVNHENIELKGPAFVAPNC